MQVKDITLGILNFFLAAVEVLLGLRFVFKLFGANSDNGFVDWVYEMSGALLEPFRGVFPTEVFENQYVLELSTIFAMVIYGLIGMAIIWLVGLLTPNIDAVPKKRR